MCGIAGVFQINRKEIPYLDKKLKVMCDLIKHRGPDGEGFWQTKKSDLGFGHRRLAIIDIETGKQPMVADSGNSVCFNGEIYNYKELKAELSSSYNFKTDSDTEVILAAYEKWGEDCLNRFRGMFAFALWDEKNQKLFCARDQFGIKPFYYATVDGVFYFCSEIKGLLPFVKEIDVDHSSLFEYLNYQFLMSENTLFKNVKQLMPAFKIVGKNENIKIERYWNVQFNIDKTHSEEYFIENLKRLISESVDIHTRSDVPLGAYVSGGIDSSLVATLAKKFSDKEMKFFVGKFSGHNDQFDESKYAEIVARQNNVELFQVDIKPDDFLRSFSKIVYHLDYPEAGTGVFAQYCVSELASKHRKVVLGGQGGDEIFGGYTRYLIAYLEQCMKGAIDGNLHNDNFVVTYESIIPNLTSLKNYQPLMKDFFKEGLFGQFDERYSRLISKSNDLKSEINWNSINDSSDLKEKFGVIFNSDNFNNASLFDKMTHFDFKTLLPGLLHVEDRVGMAWGLESRVPLLEKNLVEFAASIPANYKFKNGRLKNLFVKTVQEYLPSEIVNRQDKMGFPVPLASWYQGELKHFLNDKLHSKSFLQREIFNSKHIQDNLFENHSYSRKIWAIICLEEWFEQFVDKQAYFKKIGEL